MRHADMRSQEAFNPDGVVVRVFERSGLLVLTDSVLVDQPFDPARDRVSVDYETYFAAPEAR